MNTKTPFVALGLCALLAACGDNPETIEVTPAPVTEVPASATTSARAYSTFTGSLPASETQEPLDVTRVTPPTTETEEPIAI